MPAAPSSSSSPAPSTKSPPRIPRPPNCFMLYRADKARILANEVKSDRQLSEPRPSRGEPTRRISQMWKDESPAVRQYYQQLAEQKKLEHVEQYPGYKYQPRRGQKGGKSGRSRFATGAASQPYPTPNTERVSGPSRNSAASVLPENVPSSAYRTTYSNAAVVLPELGPAASSYTQMSAMAHRWEDESVDFRYLAQPPSTNAPPTLAWRPGTLGPQTVHYRQLGHNTASSGYREASTLRNTVMREPSSALENGRYPSVLQPQPQPQQYANPSRSSSQHDTDHTYRYVHPGGHIHPLSQPQLRVDAPAASPMAELAHAALAGAGYHHTAYF
ncbi:hypothetical protein V8E36_001573 [Tilletia maclaganii]